MALFTGHTITPDSALGGVQIQRSLRFNSGDSQYITRSCTSEGNRVKWTWSGWVKKTRVGRTSYALLSSDNGGDGGGNNGIASIYFHSSDAIHTYYDTTSGDNYGAINSNVYRDTNSWYHIVWQVDAANSTSKIWVNGVEQSIASGSQPISGYNYTMNQSGKHMSIGVDAWDVYTYSDTYIAETHYSDGQLYAASDFGYTDAQTGQWRPKNGNEIKSNITYGTNGFWLDFRDATSTTTLGYDYSGNANHWTLVNMSVTNNYNVCFTSDTPTSNFCTMSNIDKYNATIRNGGLEMTQASDPCRARGTHAMPPNTGKYYYEMEVQTGSSYTFGMKSTIRLGTGTSGNEGRYAYYGHNGYKEDASSSTSYGATYTAGDTVAILYDSDSGEVYFYKNNTSQGLAFTGVNTTDYQPYTYLDNYGTTPIVHFNFGQRPFKYTPPTGARGLSSKIFPTPVPAGVVRPKRHFDTLFYTGNGSTQSITGLEFAPDFVWIKERSSTSSHALGDTVRGATKVLQSDLTAAEVTASTNFTSFDSNGFTHGSGGRVNENSQTYVAWCWKAGGAAVTNTVGNISAQVSANDEAGFSIITYTGDGNSSGNVGTGLRSTQPLDWAIVKRTDSTSDWHVAHSGSGQSNNFAYHLNLNSTDTLSGSSPYHMGTQNATNGDRLYLAEGGLTSSATYVAYVWQERPGYSKFGSYTGTENDDGPYVHLGFSPAWVMVKCTSNSEHWNIAVFTNGDRANGTVKFISSNLTTAERNMDDNPGIDFLSNGFKVRTSDGNMSRSNTAGNFVYMAFAEQPSGTMFGRDANAR